MNDQEYIYNFQLKEDNFHRLYLDFYPSLVMFARKVLKQSEGAEDLVQDVFIRTWEARKTIPVIDNVAVYLYQAVKYRCLNELRNRDRHRLIKESISPEVSVCDQALYLGPECVCTEFSDCR